MAKLAIRMVDVKLESTLDGKTFKPGIQSVLSGEAEQLTRMGHAYEVDVELEEAEVVEPVLEEEAVEEVTDEAVEEVADEIEAEEAPEEDAAEEVADEDVANEVNELVETDEPKGEDKEE